MPHDNRPIIAERRSKGLDTRLPVLIGAGVLLIGLVALIHYAHAGLTLSHYDARAHLVVARRIADSLTPGWKQIGAVWLPLPHLVNLPIVQWEWAYRTGYPSAVLSTLLMAVGLGALGAALMRVTRSAVAVVAAVSAIVLNPNVLYLQSTPMTEPMLFGLACLALWLVGRWIDSGGDAPTTAPGAALAALTLTRYEGWFIAAALVTLAAGALIRQRPKAVLTLAAYVMGAAVSFLLLSKGSTGVWFVTSGFYQPDPSLLHRPMAVLQSVTGGTVALGGGVLAAVGAAGLVLATSGLIRGQFRAALPMALLAAVALPLYAFFQGHPFRIRYMIPVVVALGALSALVLARLPGRTQVIAAVLFVASVVWQRPPLDAQSAMVREAQWETPYRLARQEVTAYLQREWDGTPILASMGSLGHYMQEASAAGFSIVDFVHEGNGDLWIAARERPGRFVRWVLIEERAEGGDELAARARRAADYLDAFERVAEGGGVALFRRRTPAAATGDVRSGSEIPR